MPRDVFTPDGARAVTAVAPAKINLHLGVGDARPDGFHDLLTVYRAVDMWERVTVSFAGGAAGSGDDDEITVTGPGAPQVPTDRTNLAARAVDLLREEAGSDARIAIRIHKGVPVAGGMAGGSADAAAALVATDRLLGLGLGRAALEERAARLGSDVPFCVRGGTALGTGRGEKLATLLHARAEQHVVVALAAGGLSTPRVFAELDRLRAERADPEGAEREGAARVGAARPLPRAGGVEPLVEALAGDDPAAVAALLANDLEPAALSLRPALRKTLRTGQEAGALHGMVSGSGPTCLFFCSDRDHAIAVAAEISESGVAREVRVTRGPVGGAHIISDDPSGVTGPGVDSTGK
ncbi:4-(cytidine 5'-diphospho)-2-C-methyl-D-erythritol kinase [Dietzia cinnamea]|uniref:4-(cytidine 5'-diphospho)-2-C-methyl-D-erythritol kinase n=1 Tax=Dietzia cinnamea TaxID=321318 RepID=UPI0021AF01A6|nr:4-(cytidine 5'-diphospho)-2-C-methyl-D-erythritol kinase [Dietzia cinnamea]MCT2061151.1 4-(cytidine 5'-diphospho)-2-C-methyl-D-erythritol kinase [Dietzia cinnamea]MCT2235446.1 4-(cytidine 5'-diphospho)-2-C-methyl-D-erythritol kinase [Dietzia cinnamea]MCT2300550.1 4-(cytidine 5'-diphospho)-2-C-methyl-D-erythritol kinase [Dietzia cinnamea]